MRPLSHSQCGPSESLDWELPQSDIHKIVERMTLMEIRLMLLEK